MFNYKTSSYWLIGTVSASTFDCQYGIKEVALKKTSVYYNDITHWIEWLKEILREYHEHKYLNYLECP